jgi:hypothetical protein
VGSRDRQLGAPSGRLNTIRLIVSSEKFYNALRCVIAENSGVVPGCLFGNRTLPNPHDFGTGEADHKPLLSLRNNSWRRCGALH